MKSPEQLRGRLIRDWGRSQLRVERFLEDAFPVLLHIGKPTAKNIAHDTKAVRAHIEAWQKVNIGTVEWEKVNYRATGEAVSIPLKWRIDNLDEWSKACNLTEISSEINMLQSLLTNAPEMYHETLVRKKNLWRNLSYKKVCKVIEIADLLEPDCCANLPLRAYSVAGIDTKFLEHHAAMITTLLDVKYDGEVSTLGLEPFLGAIYESKHWVLVVDLDGEILPFRSMKVQTSELKSKFCSAKQLIIVENEQCLHMLPKRKDTIAILGSGLDLAWTNAAWLQQLHVSYWGDIDTWGLKMLGVVRQNIPQVTPIMMSEAIFDKYATAYSVVENISTSLDKTKGLTKEEQILFSKLSNTEKGRLEQEFIPRDEVERWLSC